MAQKKIIQGVIQGLPKFKDLLKQLSLSKLEELYNCSTLKRYEQGQTILLHTDRLQHFYVVTQGSVLLTCFGFQRASSPFLGDSRLPRSAIRDQSYFLKSKKVYGRLQKDSWFGFTGHELIARSGLDFLAEIECTLLKVQAGCFSKLLLKQFNQNLKFKLGFIRDCLGPQLPINALARQQYSISSEERPRGTLLLQKGLRQSRPFIVEEGQVVICELKPNSNCIQKKHKIIGLGRLIFQKGESPHNLAALTDVRLLYLGRESLVRICEERGVDLQGKACDLRVDIDYEADDKIAEYLAEPKPLPVLFKSYEEELDRKVWELQFKRDILHNHSCKINRRQRQLPQVFLLPQNLGSLAARRKLNQEYSQQTRKPNLYYAEQISSRSSENIKKKLGIILEQLGCLPRIRLREQACLVKSKVGLSRSRYRYYGKPKGQESNRSCNAELY